MGGGADLVGRGRGVVGRPGVAADDDEGQAGGLVAHEVGGPGQLVGDRGLGHLQDRAEAVARPALVADGGEARQADRHVGLAVAPGAPEGVGDQDRQPQPRAVLERGPQAARAGVGVVGEESHDPGLDVRRVDAGVGADQAVARLHHHGPRRVGQHADRLLHRQPAAGGGAVLGRVEPDHRALGLADRLLGDDHHVAVAQLRGGEHQRGEVVAGPDLGDALDRQDRQDHGRTRPSAARATASAISGVVMIVSVTATRTPRSATSSARSASRVSITQPSRNPA